MSRIGKLPVKIPEKVTVTLDKENELSVKGPRGELKRKFLDILDIKVGDDSITVNRKSDEKFDRSVHGLTRALINNMVIGVTEGFSKKLEIVGVGYKAEMKGKKLVLTIGYSHPIIIGTTGDIQLSTPTPNEIVISGTDKEVVGLLAAKIRSFRKPEPYKGKGIKYSGEYIRRKAGKTAGA